MVKKTLVIIKFNIEAETPIHIGTGLGVSGIIDKKNIRDSEHNVYLPGSTIKGRIRHHYSLLYPFFFPKLFHVSPSVFCMKNNIEECCPVCQIFGSKFHQGLFVFHDALLKNENLRGLSINEVKTVKDFKDIQTHIRRGIKLSRARRVAEEKKLFSLEASSPCLVYETNITGICYSSEQDASEAQKDIIVLLTAIKSLDKIGGNKSRGMGNIKIVFEEVSIGGKVYSDDMISTIIAEYFLNIKEIR